MDPARPPPRIVANDSPRTKAIAEVTRAAGHKKPAADDDRPRKIGYRKKFSLHFGISTFEHWDDLPNGARDAQTMATRFKDILGFDHSEVVLNGDVTHSGMRMARLCGSQTARTQDISCPRTHPNRSCWGI